MRGEIKFFNKEETNKLLTTFKKIYSIFYKLGRIKKNDNTSNILPTLSSLLSNIYKTKKNIKNIYIYLKT